MTKTETTWIFWVVRILTRDPKPRAVRCEQNSTSIDRHDGCPENLRVEGSEERQMVNKQRDESVFLKAVFDEVKKTLNIDELDVETIRMTERLAVLRIATKHINLWIRQLEMKRNVRAGWADEVRRSQEGGFEGEVP